MKKLLAGIIKFSETLTSEMQQSMAQLALGQSPDALMIACSDSRVVPNLFASTDPGDLFVVRNVGNIIPEPDSDSPHSEMAALEFSLKQLSVKDIIICGHSECGAMHALQHGREKLPNPHLKNWLKFAEPALTENSLPLKRDPSLSAVNHLSQMNVLKQWDHLMAYPFVRDRVNQGTLQIHGWWFSIAEVRVYAYQHDTAQFQPIIKPN